jgi:hypothetical protein
MLPGYSRTKSLESYIEYLETGSIMMARGERYVIMKGEILYECKDEQIIMMDYPGVYDYPLSSSAAVIKGFPHDMKFISSADKSVSFYMHFTPIDFSSLSNKGSIEVAISFDRFTHEHNRLYTIKPFDKEVYILAYIYNDKPNHAKVKAIGSDKSFIDHYIKKYLNI